MNMRDYPTQTQTEVREPLVNIDIYGEKKVTYRDRYEVMNRSGIIINVNTLFTSFLINLILRSFQCDFESSNKCIIQLTIQA